MTGDEFIKRLLRAARETAARAGTTRSGFYQGAKLFVMMCIVDLGHIEFVVMSAIGTTEK